MKRGGVCRVARAFVGSCLRGAARLHVAGGECLTRLADRIDPPEVSR